MRYDVKSNKILPTRELIFNIDRITNCYLFNINIMEIPVFIYFSETIKFIVSVQRYAINPKNTGITIYIRPTIMFM